MTESFKEATADFRELMRKFNHKLVTTDGKILLDSDAENYKEIEEAKELVQEIDNKEEFQELMGMINKKISAINSVTTSDNIKSPNHYVSESGIEVFDVQEAFIHELKGMAANYWCNIVKYILRFQRKNGVEDLKKAKYYLEKLIDEEE